MKWYGWIGWALFVISTICDGYWFITEYKEQISMKDKEDATKIINMLQNEHEGMVIKDIQVGGIFPVTGFMKELALMKNPNAKLNKIKSVFYEVESKNELHHYVTLFEVKYSFLDEKVGEKILTCKNDFFIYENNSLNE